MTLKYLRFIWFNMYNNFGRIAYQKVQSCYILILYMYICLKSIQIAFSLMHAAKNSPVLNHQNDSLVQPNIGCGQISRLLKIN